MENLTIINITVPPNGNNQPINPSNKIKELDGVDRALIEKRKFCDIVAVISLLVGVLGFIVLKFAAILFFLTFLIFPIFLFISRDCIIKFSKRNNEATCKHYKMIHGSEYPSSISKFNTSSTSIFPSKNSDWVLNDSMSWRHFTNDTHWRNH